MSVGAICFTSSGSNGSCWVVLVFPRLFFLFFEKRVFFSIRNLRQKKNLTRLSPKKKTPQREVVRSSAGVGVVYPPFWGSFA